MKLIIILLLALLPFTLAVDGTCADHPKIEQIAELITGLQDELTAEEFSDIQTAFQAYRESDGDSAWSTSLTGQNLQCTGFSGNSCCTDDFATHFKTIFKGTMKQKGKKEKPMQKEFLKQFGMQLGKCAGKSIVEEFIQLEAIQTFLDGLKTCRQNVAKVSMNFIRRNFCTLCFSGAEMSTNFDENDKLIVTQASIDAYDTAMLGTFQCFSDLNGDLFDAIEAFYADKYDDLEDSNACDRFADWIYALIQSGPDSIVPQKPTDCKGNARFMGNGGGCEQNMDGEGIFEEGGAMGPPSKDGQEGLQSERPDGYKPEKPQEGDQQGDQQQGDQQQGDQQSNANRRYLESLGLRVLTEDDSDFSVDAAGYEAYKDETVALGDSTIIDEAYGEESIDIDTSAIVIEEDEQTNDGDEDDDDDDDDDSSNRLNLILVVLSVILGFLL